MKHLEELIVGLAESIPADLGGEEDGIRVGVTEVDLTVPVETRLDGAGTVRASLPRGKLATGHDPIHSHLALRFAREEIE